MRADPENATLEQDIIDRPDDRRAWVTYAERLQSQGDPRGELGLIQLALEENEDAALREKEQALLAAHAAELSGAFPSRGDAEPAASCEVIYRGGFFHTLCFAGPPEVLRQVLAHPSARLLVSLSVQYMEDDREDFAPLVEALSTEPLAALRALCIGGLPDPHGEASFALRSCGSLLPLARGCPRLERLGIRCPYFVAAFHPALRILDARMGAAPPSVQSLTRAELPRLTELHLGYETRTSRQLSDRHEEALIWDDATVNALGSASGLAVLRRLCLWPTPWKRNCRVATRLRASQLASRIDQLEACNWRDFDDCSAFPL
ncbi:hypothetical protein OV203_47570 [Nannocystis sp. ILAH1]|uniref:hypothetical protein n=1 Tax=Nannocystis sp. ILAH1 TaxID=2996789 RepID=UPI00226D4231|nr:hypothetical protein [Nannocystis sp. ILAH1]MCY0994879.1 hypothetical protein [Nannocystis sp. ILAH1]